MPLPHYGVLKGTIVDRRPNDRHYQVHVLAAGVSYRVSVNVCSAVPPSMLEYLLVDGFEHPLTTVLPALKAGFTPIHRSHNHDLALDYVRGGLLQRAHFLPLPHHVPGPDNDLNDLIDFHIDQAMADSSAVLYAWGEPWGPEGWHDRVFGFKPGRGMHNVHMNQGNATAYRKDDGVWQDGGLLLHLPAKRKWVALFLKFQSQTWKTDNRTGHRFSRQFKTRRIQRVR